MSRRLMQVVLQWAAVGCGPERLVIAPPDPEGARSLLFALDEVDALSIRAVDLDGGVPATSFELDRLGGPVIYALFYDSSLEENGIAAGPVELLAGGRPIPAPDRVRRAAVGREVGPWEETVELGDRLEAARIARTSTSPCEVLGEERVFDLGTTADAAFALRIDGRSAIVGTTDARLFVVTATGARRLGRVAPVSAFSGYLDPAGVLYVGGRGGRLFAGAIGSRLAEIGAAASSDALRSMDGPRTGTSGEIYAVTSSGGFERFDGSTWRTLVPPGPAEDWKRGVAWIDDGRAIAVGLSTPVLRADGDRIAPVEADSTDPLIAVRHAGELGTFATSLTGRILRSTGGRFETIEGSPIEVAASAIAPLAGGVVFAGGVGTVSQWHPGWGFCALDAVPSPIVKHIAVLDEWVVFLGDSRKGSGPEDNAVIIRHRGR
jgi:hypothetical protein